MLDTKTIAAARRGFEAAVLAAVGYLAASYIALNEHTGSAVIDVVRDNGDKAIGVAIMSLIVGFGLTRSPIPNVSPVAENQPSLAPAPDVDPGNDGNDTVVGPAA